MPPFLISHSPIFNFNSQTTNPADSSLHLLSMKRTSPDSQVPQPKLKKPKQETTQPEPENGFMNLDENLLYEVLKHVDARSLAMASCVSKQWFKTAKDERLWELICSGHWANIDCGTQQLRSVVLPLGGFRRLHSRYLWRLSKPPAAASASRWAPPKNFNSKPSARWGKDEVHLCLSLLSIQYYEKIILINSNK